MAAERESVIREQNEFKPPLGDPRGERWITPADQDLERGPVSRRSDKLARRAQVTLGIVAHRGVQRLRARPAAARAFLLRRQRHDRQLGLGRVRELGRPAKRGNAIGAGLEEHQHPGATLVARSTDLVQPLGRWAHVRECLVDIARDHGWVTEQRLTLAQTGLTPSPHPRFMGG